MKDSITTNNKITALDGIVFFGTIIYFILRIYFSSGQLSPDGINYLLQAQNFWEYKVNFPLGYPFLIKLFSTATGSLFWASKIVNILGYIGIILFSFKKKFFFSHTLFIFSFYPFLEFFTQTLSESVYYFFNYVIIYYIHKISTEGFRMKFLLYLSLLLFILVSIRFSGIFVLLSTIIYFAYLKHKKEISFKHLFLLSLAMSSGVACYIFINYLYSGFPLGERNHLLTEHGNIFKFLSEISLSTFRDFSFLNGLLHQGILQKISFMNIFTGIVILSLFIITYYKNRKTNRDFTVYLLISFIVILSGVWYSYYTTRIDDTIRIKSTPYYYLVFLLLINIQQKSINYLKILALFIISINTYTILKHSETILKYYANFDNIICKSADKSVNIIYTGRNCEERSNASILIFKAISIDRNYKIIESSEKDTISSKTNCDVYSSKLIK